ncbi:hypothetical protein F441_04177 [Phytophthora nicotianae CJ01A1]|uniref:Uncharacterized protein n=1 Tax=Phytophthora nicotianae CJ01A1 TaxID=1317063 RepID=W2XIP0_PHYNI|nr:hypothetical protein F441_04177 [Phytophthora nicotianae CJ01A1]
MPEKVKFVIWRKAGWDYNILKQQLFKGVPKEVYEKDPRFEKVLLRFGAYMRSLYAFSTKNELRSSGTPYPGREPSADPLALPESEKRLSTAAAKCSYYGGNVVVRGTPECD